MTFFFRLLKTEIDAKGERLAEMVQAANVGETTADRFAVEPSEFSKIPGSPFAYWVNERVPGLFVNCSILESPGIHACKGSDTGDDFRFLRTWWEIAQYDIGKGQRWVNHPKGGSYSRYYSEVHLLINWQGDGELIRQFGNVRIRDLLYRPGLTWPRRTNDLSFRGLPAGSILVTKAQECSLLGMILNYCSTCFV